MFPHLCYLTSGPSESSHRSYCSYTAEDYTNRHLFLDYFIGQCSIVPYKLVTTYPLGCGRGLFLWSDVGRVPSEEGPGLGQGVAGNTLASFKSLLKFCLSHFSLFGPKPVASSEHSQHCHISHESIWFIHRRKEVFGRNKKNLRHIQMEGISDKSLVIFLVLHMTVLFSTIDLSSQAMFTW